MSYHISNLGSFGSIVKIYTDNNGYIPEPGDIMVDDWNSDQRDWDKWCDAASKATQQAEEEISHWQNGR